MIESISVKLDNPYRIVIGNNILENAGELIKNELPYKRFAIITDEIVSKLYLDKLECSLKKCGLECESIIIEGGEQNKNIKTVYDIYSLLSRKSITRGDCIIALGGGVVGDMAGFAASTYLRGISYIQIPTTLLAQVDSSIGGKTAVDIEEGKNLVGSFWQPSFVIIDTDTLNTLPECEFNSGMAEAIKSALIGDKELFEMFKKYDRSNINVKDVILKSIFVKKKYVEKDVFDNGERHILNFGHTIGHAVEKASGYELKHGEAVSIGMSAICSIGEIKGYTRKGIKDELNSILDKYSLSHNIANYKNDCIKFLNKDKKNRGGAIDAVFIDDVGEPFIKEIGLDELYVCVERL